MASHDGDAKPSDFGKRSDSLTDLALTLPIFVAYHLGVVFLPVRNAADPVTGELAALAQQSLPMYCAITVAIGIAFVVLLLTLGKRKSLKLSRFALIAFEGALYAVLMRGASSYVVGRMSLGGPTEGGLGSVVMALGAGFYEEVLFRAILFGTGAFVVKKLIGKGAIGFALMAGWAIVEAFIFSGWHYVGAMGDGFSVQSFVFRAVCGLVLTAVFAFRGFAPAVWTHAIYDLWVMV